MVGRLISNHGSIPHRALLVGFVGALVTAAALVIYLQHRAAARQGQQTERILQQVCERTATLLAGRMRQLLDEAVLDTIEGIGHPQLLEHDVPVVAALFATGLRRHPYIDRFFLWSAQRSSPLPDEVLFFSQTPSPSRPVRPVYQEGQQIGWLVSEPELGREILRLARDYSGQRTFVVLERTIGGVPYQIIIHLLWNDERRRDFFGLLGYTVNLANLNSEMLDELLAADIEKMADPDPLGARLVVSVIDENGRVVYGGEPIPGGASARAPVEMLFFPGEPLKAWVAATPPVKVWHLMTTSAAPASAAGFDAGLVGGIVVLLAVAVLCALAADRQARRLSKMQADFVANVTHQLKTPVAMLSAAAQTLGLERVRSPAKLKEYLEIVRVNTARLATLMDRILQFSRLQAGAFGYVLKDVDLATLSARAVDRFNADHPDRAAEIRFYAPSRPLRVLADGDAIEEVLMNLLENAVNYSGPNSEVTVRLEEQEEHAVLTIYDNGAGIAAEDLPHVFDKFYRGRAGHRSHGFGLGLAIARAIVEAHGGSITVESQIGQGTEFRVHLPFAQEGRHAAAHSGSRRRTADASHPAG